MYCEKCEKEIKPFESAAYSDFTILCKKCSNEETQLDCTLLSEELIKRISDGLEFIDDEEE